MKSKNQSIHSVERWFEASEALEETLKEHCKQKMAPFKAPRLIEFLKDLLDRFRMWNPDPFFS
jgi:acyl-CoA synthetase (AMP-forming)/AMP-acid ligase II